MRRNKFPVCIGIEASAIQTYQKRERERGREERDEDKKWTHNSISMKRYHVRSVLWVIIIASMLDDYALDYCSISTPTSAKHSFSPYPAPTRSIYVYIYIYIFTCYVSMCHFISDSSITFFDCSLSAFRFSSQYGCLAPDAQYPSVRV